MPLLFQKKSYEQIFLGGFTYIFSKNYHPTIVIIFIFIVQPTLLCMSKEIGELDIQFKILYYSKNIYNTELNYFYWQQKFPL